jgi:hypothetical protein
LGFFFFSCSAEKREKEDRSQRRSEESKRTQRACLATFGVWPRTLPALASEPCTFPMLAGDGAGVRREIETLGERERTFSPM